MDDRLGGLCKKVFGFDWRFLLRCAVVSVILCAVCFCAGYYRGTHVHDQPERTGQIEYQLNNIADDQREITDRIGKSAQRAGNIQERIDRSEAAVSRAQESVGRIGDNFQDARKLIESSKRILEAVRQRRTTD